MNHCTRFFNVRFCSHHQGLLAGPTPGAAGRHGYQNHYPGTSGSVPPPPPPPPPHGAPGPGQHRPSRPHFQPYPGAHASFRGGHGQSVPRGGSEKRYDYHWQDRSSGSRAHSSSSRDSASPRDSTSSGTLCTFSCTTFSFHIDQTTKLTFSLALTNLLSNTSVKRMTSHKSTTESFHGDFSRLKS